MKITMEGTEYSKGRSASIIIKGDDVVLDDLLGELKNLLLGFGYVFNGELVITEPES